MVEEQLYGSTVERTYTIAKAERTHNVLAMAIYQVKTWRFPIDFPTRLFFHPYYVDSFFAESAECQHFVRTAVKHYPSHLCLPTAILAWSELPGVTLMMY